MPKKSDEKMAQEFCEKYAKLIESMSSEDLGGMIVFGVVGFETGSGSIAFHQFRVRAAKKDEEDCAIKEEHESVADIAAQVAMEAFAQLSGLKPMNAIAVQVAEQGAPQPRVFDPSDN